ncbi:MAG: oligosaccharide flippase family protein [bacterium]|nr:oligosaccharide flippase family protein [bacterium]
MPKFAIFKHKLMRSALSLFCLSIISYLLKYFLNTFISSQLPTALYGDFGLTIRTILLLSLILLLGTNSSAIKYLSKYISKKHKKHMYSFMAWNLKVILRTFKICFILIFLFYIIVFILNAFGITKFDTYYNILYSLWIVPIAALSILLASYLLCNKWTVLYFLLNKIASSFFLIILFAIAIYFLKIKLTYFTILIIIFISVIMILTIEIFLVNKMFRKNDINIRYKMNNQALLIRPEWKSESVKFISTQIVVLLIATTSLYILKFTSSNKDLVGYYTAILIISNMIWIIPSSLSLLIKPKVNLLTSYNKFKKFQVIINTVNRMNSTILIILYILIIIFGNKLLGTFGPKFKFYYIPLLIQSGAFLLGSLINPAEQTLTYCNLKKEIRVNIYELSSLVIIGIPMAYVYGITGIAIAALISISIKAILVYTFVKKTIPIKPLTIF